MRKITQEVVGAFMAGFNYANSNTTVSSTTRDDSKMFLHGNLIAIRNGNIIQVTLAGWNTNTTRERLNGIPGVHVTTKLGQTYINGNPCGNYDWVTI